MTFPPSPPPRKPNPAMDNVRSQCRIPSTICDHIFFYRLLFFVSRFFILYFLRRKQATDCGRAVVHLMGLSGRFFFLLFHFFYFLQFCRRAIAGGDCAAPPGLYPNSHYDVCESICCECLSTLSSPSSIQPHSRSFTQFTYNNNNNTK